MTDPVYVEHVTPDADPLDPDGPDLAALPEDPDPEQHVGVVVDPDGDAFPAAVFP